jgi:hypothetical protein
MRSSDNSCHSEVSHCNKPGTALPSLPQRRFGHFWNQVTTLAWHVGVAVVIWQNAACARVNGGASVL